MLKKCVIAATIFGMSLSAFASNSVYVGVGSGITTNTSKNANGNPGIFRGMPLAIFAGYSTVVDPNLYLAGELSATLATAEITNKNNMKTSYSYGIGFLPGIMLSEHSVMFGRIGIVRTEFAAASDTRLGGQLGFGLQSSMTQNIELRGEYIFTAYGDVSGIKSPRKDEALASIVYRFD